MGHQFSATVRLVFAHGWNSVADGIFVVNAPDDETFGGAELVTASTSSALVPLMKTGPVSAWTMPRPFRGMALALENSAGSRVRSKASRPT